MQSNVVLCTFLNDSLFLMEDWEIIKVKSMDDLLPPPQNPKIKRKEWEIVSLPAAVMKSVSKPVLSKHCSLVIKALHDLMYLD